MFPTKPIRKLIRKLVRKRLAFAFAFAALFAALFATAPVLPAQNAQNAQDAQDAQDTIVTLPELAVHDTTSAAAAIALRELREIPGGVSVVDTDALRGARMSTPADLFALQPGVLVLSAFGGLDHPRLSIRGASIQRASDPSAGRGILFLQDGFPINFSDGSFDFVEFLDPTVLDHALIARGGNALTLGATMLGGAINLVSPTGLDAPGGLVRGEAGSHGYLREQLSVSAVKGRADIRFSASGFSLDGWRDYNHQEAARALLNAGLRLGNGWSNRVYLSAMHSRVEVTGVQTLAQIAARDTSALPMSIAAQISRDTSQYRLGDRLSRQFPDGGTLAIGAGIAYVDYTFTQGTTITRARNTDANFDANWTKRDTLFGALLARALPNTFTAGARAQLGRRDQQIFLNGSGAPPNLGGILGPMFADNRLRAQNATLWLDDQLTLGRGFTLIASLSAMRANRINKDRYAAIRPGQRDDSSDSTSTTALMPRIGFRYEHHESGGNGAFQWFGNITRGCEPLTWDALLATIPGSGSGQQLIDGPNPRRVAATRYAAQRATTLETGVRGNTGRLAYDVTLYRSWLNDELLLLATDATGAATQFGNAARTIHQGIEAALGYEILKTGPHSIIARASYTWSDFYFAGDPVWKNNALPVIAPHYAQFALYYHHKTGWHAGATLTWQPRGAWADYANTLRAPGYAVVALNAGYARAKGLSIFIDVQNLLNRRYVTGMNAGAGTLAGQDAARFFAGDPISLYAGAEWRW